MSDKKWKRRERQVAAFFGTQRNSLSGVNAKVSASDTLHETLFIEHKHRKSSTVVNLFEKVTQSAQSKKHSQMLYMLPDRAPFFRQITAVVTSVMNYRICFHRQMLSTILSIRIVSMKMLKLRSKSYN